MVTAVFLAHLVGDYILQWNALAIWKSRALKGVVAHGAIVWAVTWLLTAFFDPAWWPWALFIGLTHTVIDALPLWLGKYVTPLQRFVADQAAHCGLMLVALGASGYLGEIRLMDSLVASLQDYRLLTFALGYAFITMPAWVLVEFMVYGAVRGPAPDFPPTANKFLGILERGLITTFVVLGQFTLVPLVALPRLVFSGASTHQRPTPARHALRRRVAGERGSGCGDWAVAAPVLIAGAKPKEVAMLLIPSDHGTKPLSPEAVIAVQREKPYNSTQPVKLARPEPKYMNRALFLKHIPLFADLSATELQVLAQELSRVQFKKGDAIFYEGDPGQTLYIVESGHVRIYLQCEDGQETSVNVCTSGDIFGELAVIDGLPRSASAIALEDSVVLALSREQFRECTRRYPQLAFNFLKALSVRVRYNTQQIDSLSAFRVSSRLARKTAGVGPESRGSGGRWRAHSHPAHAERPRQPDWNDARKHQQGVGPFSEAGADPGAGWGDHDY